MTPIDLSTKPGQPQVLRLCQKVGLVSLGHVTLVGTKVIANASKHNATSHERLLKSEKQLEAEMQALLRMAELIDTQENSQIGRDKRGEELPEEHKRGSSRLEWIRKAKAAQPAGNCRCREGGSRGRSLW